MTQTAVFFRLLEEDDKGEVLGFAAQHLNQGRVRREVFPTNALNLRVIPGSPLAYWAGPEVLRAFILFPCLESEGRAARVGDHPGDGFRYIRLAWEPQFVLRESRWHPYQKGGDFSPYYYDIHLVVDWDENGQTYRGFQGRPGRSAAHPSNFQFFFRSGLTWPRRSQRGFSVRALPGACVFADKGPSIFVENDSSLTLLATLAITNSIAFKRLLQLQMAFGSYEVGVIQRTPVPPLTEQDELDLAQLGEQAFEIARSRDFGDETTHVFDAPSLARFASESVYSSLSSARISRDLANDELERVQTEIDTRVGALYGFTADDLDIAALQPVADDSDDTELDDDESEFTISRTPTVDVENLLMYAVGAIFGRWDIRISLDLTLAPKLQGPFDPLPVCSLGMLIGPDGLPAKPGGIVSEEWLRARPDAITLPPDGTVADPVIPDAAYPLRFDWDGILVDDDGHPDDIVSRVREVLTLLWGERAEAIEREACEVLEVAELRDYFRNPKRFWDFHVKRYSKSRRKAPIYWLLQSSKRSFGLWISYHRMDADILYKALRTYADPKLTKERQRLDTLARGRAAAEAAGGRMLRDHDRAVERQQAVVAEIEQFRKSLEQVALLNLTVDHDDGVLISIAPLHELVPWKPAAQIWQELASGKYEWSTMAQRMCEKGLIHGGRR